MNATDQKTSVYDLPTRLFHWMFAGLFLAAFIIANTVDDESALFSYHMMAGLSMAFLLVLRIIWGFIGSTYARFSSFEWNPAELVRYFRDLVVAKTKRYLSHNPASSYLVLFMFLLTIGLAVTGITMAGGGGSDFNEDAHELMADLFLVSVVVHIAGMVIHHIRHKDYVWMSMFDGKKETVPGETGIKSMKPVAGVLLIVLTLSWFGYLSAQYDNNTRTLNFFGTELRLGEEEHKSHSSYQDEDEDREENEEHNDDDHN